MPVNALTRSEQLHNLMQMAEHALGHAHAPLSNLRVGAAVLTAAGRMHAGCNVESTVLPLGGCAERHAIAACVLASGQRPQITAVAIAARDGNDRPQPIPPCGACRQLIHEFGARAVVGWRERDGQIGWHSIDELLPRAFVLADY